MVQDNDMAITHVFELPHAFSWRPSAVVAPVQPCATRCSVVQGPPLIAPQMGSTRMICDSCQQILAVLDIDADC